MAAALLVTPTLITVCQSDTLLPNWSPSPTSSFIYSSSQHHAAPSTSIYPCTVLTLPLNPPPHPLHLPLLSSRPPPPPPHGTGPRARSGVPASSLSRGSASRSQSAPFQPAPQRLPLPLPRHPARRSPPLLPLPPSRSALSTAPPRPSLALRPWMRPALTRKRPGAARLLRSPWRSRTRDLLLNQTLVLPLSLP